MAKQPRLAASAKAIGARVPMPPALPPHPQLLPVNEEEPEGSEEQRIRLESIVLEEMPEMCMGFVLDVTAEGRDWVDSVVRGDVKLGRKHGSQSALLLGMETIIGAFHLLPEEWYGMPVFKLADPEHSVFCAFCPASIAGDSAEGWYISSTLEWSTSAVVYAYAKDSSRAEGTSFPVQWHMPYNRSSAWSEMTVVELTRHMQERIGALEAEVAELEYTIELGGGQAAVASGSEPFQPQQPQPLTGGPGKTASYLGPVSESLTGDRTGGINRAAALVCLHDRQEWARLGQRVEEYKGLPNFNGGRGLGPHVETALRGVSPTMSSRNLRCGCGSAVAL